MTDEAASYGVQIQWPAYFEMSQDELTTLTNRTQQQVAAGFLTQERAVERVAQAEGVTDVEALMEELAECGVHGTAIEEQGRPEPTTEGHGRPRAAATEPSAVSPACAG